MENTESNTKKEYIKWDTIEEQYFTDSYGKPALVKLNGAMIDGKQKFGVTIVYKETFLNINCHDIPKFIGVLQKIQQKHEEELKNSK